MIRRTSALAPALVGVALVAAPVLGQQLTRRSSGPASGASSQPANPMAGARSARTLMRNGLDYLSYQEYERALEFFREAETRKVELSADEVKQLKEGIDRAQQGLREVANSPRKAYAKSRVGQSRPGAIATVQPPKDPEAPDETEPVRLVAGEGETAPGAASSGADVPPAIPQTLPQDLAPATPRSRARRAPRRAPAQAGVAATEPDPSAIAGPPPRAEGPARPPAPAELRDLPPLPALVARPATPPPPLTLPGTEPAPTETAGAALTAPAEPPGLPPPPGEAPGTPAATASAPLITPDAAAMPPSEVLPPMRGNLAEVPPTDVPNPAGPQSTGSEPPQTAAATQPPAISTPRAPVAPGSSDWHMPARVAAVGSSLTPDLRREVEKVAELQDEEARRRAAQPQPAPEPPAPGLLTENEQPTAKLELPRAPSPTEARPLRAIPVPEEFVPLAPRNWAPSRKYWAAAATCHAPLYFQNAMLERYGHSVEQYVGPLGRYLTYPIDDPTQSNQRSQIAQPFFSAGLLALQIMALPYNMIVDPPWEAEYDLGYWRPGDRVPPDLYYLPLTDVGPPLRGANY